MKQVSKNKLKSTLSQHQEIATVNIWAESFMDLFLNKR